MFEDEEYSDIEEEDLRDDVSEEEEPAEGQEEQEEGVSGWADSMAKILKSNKPKNKKELMLSRARKDYEVNKTVVENRRKLAPVQDTFEIVPNAKTKSDKDEVSSSEIVDAKSNSATDDNILSLKVQRKLELKQKKLELAWENLARMNTEKSDPEVEKDLLKIATKGVVQLFNAISMQQNTIKSKLLSSRKSEFQKDKILNQTKDIFDTALVKSKRIKTSNSLADDVKIKEESDEDDFEEVADDKRKRKFNNNQGSKMSKKNKPSWNALQDDFMLGAKLKDWDKNSDSE